MNIYKALKGMLFNPRVRSWLVLTENLTSFRSIRVEGKRVTWSDRPDPSTVRKYGDVGDPPNRIEDKLNQEWYEKSWGGAELNYKVFKKLRESEWIEEIQKDKGNWIPTNKGYEEYHRLKRQLEAGRGIYSRSPRRSRKIRRSSYVRKYINREHIHYEDLPIPDRKEILLMKQGKFHEAQKQYIDRTNASLFYHGGFLRDYFKENGGRVGFPRRKGWRGRLNQKKLKEKISAF